MRLHLISSLAFAVLAINCVPTGRSITNVRASGDSSPSGGLLSTFKSVLRDFLGDRDRSSTEYESGDNFPEQTYKMFLKIYNKTYSTQEELIRRMRIFLKRRKELHQSARDFDQGLTTFRMGENPFIDLDETELKALTGVVLSDELLPEERKALIAESKKQRRRRRRSIGFMDENEVDLRDSPWYDLDNIEDDDDEDDEDYGVYNDDDEHDSNPTVQAPEQLPASKDWRLTGCIAEPNHQRECGCCYAISTMNTIESMRCLHKHTSATLSFQHIVDCATPRAGYRNKGCDGGWPTIVLEYLTNTGRAIRERCYPYVRRQEFCRLRQVSQQPGCSLNASPTDTQLSYKILYNENDILRHVAHTGPVITVMKASRKFLFYSDGIFDDPTCSRARRDVDHAVVIVGYGRESGIDYWLIKNSWGKHWGERGFGKYRRGRNACSIGHWGWVITS